MLSRTQAAAGFVLAATGALAVNPGAAMVETPCPGAECSIPEPSTCIRACLDEFSPQHGCTGADDWDCYCANYRAITSKAFSCMYNSCGIDDYNTFNNAAVRACECLGADCPSSSTVVVTTTTTFASTSSTITPAPSCPHPCAAEISAVPECGISCISSAAGAVGCDANDYDCRCSSSAAIQQSAIGCVLGACGLGQGLEVADAVKAVCNCVTASPTTACETSTPTITVDTTTTSESESTSIITPAPTCPHPCAAEISAVPECGVACISSAAGAVGCDASDYDCRCSSSAAIQQSAIDCVLNSCGLQDGLAVADAVKVVCSCVSASPTTACEDSTSSTSSSGTTDLSTTTSESSTITSESSSIITPAPSCTQPCGAQISAVPSCGVSCIASAAGAVGCGDTDYACRCSSSAAIQQSAIGCVLGACGLEQGLAVADAVGAVCACVSASPTSTCDETSSSTTSADDGEDTPCPTSFITTTKVIEVTTTTCEEDEETSAPVPSQPPVDDGDDDDGEGSDSDDEGGDGGGSYPVPTPSLPPVDGGDEDDGGSGPSTTSSPGGGSTTARNPPVATAGASNVMLVGTGCLAGVVAAVVAFM
ncbi:hypothetical protein MFIFM68171_07243 [Madurella fahalii]|uniref:CFEM domain-containing protein n=1 Tax=Madurella fahalii TaxID=1157608 RepID=A0ABQ0GH03_9PEZI